MVECMKCGLLKTAVLLAISTLFVISPINMNFGDFDVGVIEGYAATDSFSCIETFDDGSSKKWQMSRSTGSIIIEISSDKENLYVYAEGDSIPYGSDFLRPGLTTYVAPPWVEEYGDSVKNINITADNIRLGDYTFAGMNALRYVSVNGMVHCNLLESSGIFMNVLIWKA